MKSLLRVSALMCVVTVFVAPLARAQSPVDAFLATSGLSAEAAEAIRPLLNEAHAAGLPTGYLLRKAREGAAKRVPTPILVRVLRQLRGHLGDARALVPAPHRQDAALVESLARAGFSGVSKTDLGTLLPPAHVGDTFRPRIATRLAEAARDIRELGIDSRRTVALVATLNRFDPKALDHPSDVLSTLIAARRIRRATWDRAVDEVLQAVSRTGSLAGVRRAMMLPDSAHGPAGLQGKSAARRALAPGQTGTIPGQSGQNPGGGAPPPGKSGATPHPKNPRAPGGAPP